MKQIGKIPVVISKGTSYEIGLNHGKSHPEKIQKGLDRILSACLQSQKLTLSELYEAASQFLKPVERYHKEYIEEIQGIADGAGLKLLDLMVLNSRTELQKIAAVNLQDSENTPEACTSVAVTGERTADGATYVGQTWDALSGAGECLIYHIIEQTNGKPSIAYCGEAGLITRSGINSCGIGDGVNSLFTDAPVNPDGVPLQFLLRGVLDSRNLGEAIDALENGQNAAVSNILIAQKDGETFSVELDTKSRAVLYPTDGILTHANHFVAPDYPKAPYLDCCRGNSYIRHHRSHKLLQAVPGKIGLSDIQKVLSDHGNAPECICWHSNGDDQYETVFSFICNLSTLEVSLSPHYPCEGFVTFKPFDLL